MTIRLRESVKRNGLDTPAPYRNRRGEIVSGVAMFEWRMWCAWRARQAKRRACREER